GAARHFLAFAAMFILLFAAYVRFVRFNRAAASVKHAARMRHRFAQTMRHEPRRLVSHSEHTFDLLARNSFLAARHERGSEHPFIKRDLRALENRAYGYGELIAAMSAVIQARAMGFAVQFG